MANLLRNSITSNKPRHLYSIFHAPGFLWFRARRHNKNTRNSNIFIAHRGNTPMGVCSMWISHDMWVRIWILLPARFRRRDTLFICHIHLHTFQQAKNSQGMEIVNAFLYLLLLSLRVYHYHSEQTNTWEMPLPVFHSQCTVNIALYT